MKLFLKIFGGIIAVIVVLVIALNLYLTDERLKNIIMPRLNEMADREIQVERISYTFWRTFPSFGLVVENLEVPDTQPEPEAVDTRRGAVTGQRAPSRLAGLDEMILSVELFPLLSGNVNVTRLDLINPYFNYVIYEDGTTNLDSLMEFMENQEDEPEEATATQIDLKSLTLKGGQIGYFDHSTNTVMTLGGLELALSLRYGELLETDLTATAEALGLRYDGDRIINNLPVSLSQRSTLDMENERLEISTGKLNIRGLDLDLEGELAEWSAPEMWIDLRLNSASDDFAALLEMVPDAFKEDLEGVETRGSLVMNAAVTGRMGEGVVPDFEAIIGVEDGYIRYPGVEEPIEEIQVSILANNELITIERFTARADINNLSATGKINRPLEDDADFDFDVDFSLDLETIGKFYPLDGTQLRGKMTAKANARGKLAETENAQFNADVVLADGYVKMADLEEAVRNINVELNATQDVANIRSFSADAAGNRLRLSGTVNHPLDDQRTRFNLKGNLDLDLATIPRFYPVDTDTLDMRGKLTFDGTASGRTADIENAAVNGNLNLEGGYIRYHQLPKPLEDIIVQSRITSDKITLSRASMRTGSNRFTATGDINKYMTDNPDVNILVNGNFELAEVKDFVDLQPWINELSGSTNTNLRVIGPVNDPEKLRFNGNLRASNVNVSGDSLPQPIRDLNGNLVFNNDDLDLREFTMKMGSSDFDFRGTLKNYMRLVEESPSGLAELTATYKSRKLNVDEIYEWEPTPEGVEPEPFPVHLPKLRTNLTAEIDELIFFGVTVRNLKGRLEGTDTHIAVSNAEANLLGGKMTGRMRWDVPDPERTKMTFNGSMENVRVEDIFKEFNPAGLESVRNYLSGGLSATIEYVTEMDVYFDPVLETTVSEGNFQLRRGTLRDHPTQIRAAELLRTPELRNLSLDNMNSSYTIKDGVMTLKDFNLTSREIGMELNGTQNIIDGRINYRAVVVLPGNLGRNLEPLITKEGVEALKRSDGKIPVPVLVGGTTESPNVRLDTSEIEKKVADYLRRLGSDAAQGVRDRLRDLLRN